MASAIIAGSMPGARLSMENANCSQIKNLMTAKPVLINAPKILKIILRLLLVVKVSAFKRQGG